MKRLVKIIAHPNNSYEGIRQRGKVGELIRTTSANGRKIGYVRLMVDTDINNAQGQTVSIYRELAFLMEELKEMSGNNRFLSRKPKNKPGARL